jgi:cytochrome c556
MVAIPALVLCSFGAAGAVDDGTLYVRPSMQGPVNDATNALWDIGNNAMDDEGGIDPAQMDEAKWAKLVDAAGQLEAEAQTMASAQTIRAALPGEGAVVQPGAYAMKDVQRYIDADPQAFRLLAKALGDHAAKISAAAKARDARNAGLLVGGLDQVCESCHAEYWYPEG